jgi:hypothetical protein
MHQNPEGVTFWVATSDYISREGIGFFIISPLRGFIRAL